MDGLKILLGDSKSNLGWRIVSKSFLNEVDFKALVTSTGIDGAKNVSDLLDKTHKKTVDGMLKILRALKDDKTIDENALDILLKKINVDPHQIAKEFLKGEVFGSQKGGNAGVRKIPIKATTIQSSKGLAAEYVFITNFDDQYFIKNKDKKKIADQDICNFLVALTRAKKKVFLISSNTKKEPIFLKWINKDRIEKIS